MLNFDVNDSLFRYSIKEIPIDAIITDKKSLMKNLEKKDLSILMRYSLHQIKTWNVLKVYTFLL